MNTVAQPAPKLTRASHLPAKAQYDARAIDSKTLLVPAGLAVLLLLMSQYSYLLFHTFAELFAIVIGMMAFVVAWSSYPVSRHHYLLVLGTGYFWVAVLDLLHALTFKGMNILPAFPSTHPAAQLWIAARGSEALLLLLAPLFLTHRARRELLFALFGLTAIALFALIASGHFPSAVIPDKGQTPFKITSEYIIIGILALAMAHLWHRREQISRPLLRLILLANTCTILAELSFTYYVDAYDLSNLVGHLFKVFAFFFIFQALVRYTLRQPFESLAWQHTELATLYSALEKHTITSITDANGVILEVNDNFCRTSQYTRAELIGQTHRVVKSGLYPQEFYQELWQTLGAGRVWQGVIQNRRKDGTIFWLQNTIAPFLGSDGHPSRFLETATDITELKQAELRQHELQQQLQQSQKMQALGQLTGGIAHDFNNILASILGYTELALERHTPDKSGKLAEYLGQILQAGQRARDLVASMLAFSRGTGKAGGRGHAHHAVDAAPILREAQKMLLSMLPSSIRLDFRIGHNLPRIALSPVALHQIIFNLCINARDALSGQGEIHVSLETANAFSGLCDSCHQPVSGDFVALTVQDNGVGIAAEHLARIFEPFFTTKANGRGTGMGLSMVHGLAHEGGGHVRVRSQPGSGTTITILLRTAGPATPKTQTDASATAPIQTGHGESVLIVDDETALATLLGETIAQHGYTTHVFTSSRAALEAFLKTPAKFAAVISDQTMPDLTGIELARTLREARPDMPIILCSGHSDQLDEQTALHLGASRYFMKPVPLHRLLQALHEVTHTAPEPDATATPGSG